MRPWARRACLQLALALSPAAGSCDTGRAIVDGACEPGCGESQVCVQSACVGNGSLRVTLVWDLPGDLDLYLRTPNGSEVFFAQPMGDGALLDRDDRSQTGPENVFWARTPPTGEYQVCVVPFAVTTATRFIVTVARPGLEPLTFRGERTASAGRVSCDASSTYRVGSFTLP